ERAVRHLDRIAAQSRFVSQLGQHLTGTGERVAVLWEPLGQCSTGGARALLQKRLYRIAGGDAFRDRTGHQLRGELVLTLRHTDRHIRARPAVHLRRPARTGAAAAGQPYVVGLEQPGLLQPVQMELRLVAGQVQGRGGGVTADRFGLVAYEVVEGFTSAVGQRADGGHLLVELIHRILRFYRTANLTLEIPRSNVKV